MAPFVTGEVNPAALEALVRLCVDLDRLRHHGTGGVGQDDSGGSGTTGTGTGVDDGQGAPGPDTARAWEALERAIIGKAADLLSGPGGLASFLRRRQLGARLGGPSLPLDIGYSEAIPAGIRNAVTLRDQHCRWAGGCSQPASACEVHHVRHKANGGKTSTRDCVLLCFYHHQVVIRRWGWTLVLNPDGTTTAWNKDRTKVLHSHDPPGRHRVTPPAAPGTTKHHAGRQFAAGQISRRTANPADSVGQRQTNACPFGCYPLTPVFQVSV